jgi:subfamily B ATP-binding cassette protein MsbA
MQIPKFITPEIRSDLRRMMALVAPYWGRFTLAAFLLIVSTLIGLALPWAIRILVDTVFVAGNQPQLDLIALGLLVLFIAQSLLLVGNTYLMAQVGQRVIADFRVQVHAQLTGLPLRFFAERRTGEIVSRVSNDVTLVQEVVTETPINFLRQIINLVGGLVLMLVMNWQLTLIIFAIIPPIILVGVLFGRRLQSLATAAQDRIADTTVTLEEMLSGIRVVKSFAREAFEKGRFQLNVEAAYQTTMQRVRVRSVFIPLISFLGFGALTFLLWYGGRQVIAGTLTPGELVAFLFYMMMVAGPLGEFAGLYARVREALGAGRRLFEILDAESEPLETPDAVVPSALRGGVRFENVSFGYQPDQPILKGISLEVQPGEMIAIVGPSGVGKTTLVNLLPRFFDATAGVIEIDSVDVRRYNLRALREQMGLVPQETFLFGGTVRENIAYGKMDASSADLESAARAANAHDFIQAFPEGYETLVGEKGVRLSMGQRQRVAIARMLLKDPRILILDEATSSLDSESERLVQEALERLTRGRTSFVIAHRLSTIQRADRIVVLQNGQIVEQGSHAALLTKSGVYEHLWSLQFADFEVLEVENTPM